MIATVAGLYKFNYTYLGRDFSRGLTYLQDQELEIKGEWFNEGANLVGNFIAPDDTLVSDSNGVSDISLTIVKVVE